MSVKYALKELLVRKHRAIINCIGIAMAVTLIISLYSLSSAYKNAVKKPFEESGIDLVIQRTKAQNESSNKTANRVILPDSAAPITNSEVYKVMNIDGIEDIATSLQVWSFDRGNFKVIVGIDPNSPEIGPVMFKNWVNEGRFFNSDEKNVAVVEKHFAKSYGLKVGNNIEISGENFEIIGSVEVKEGSQLSAPNVFLPINEVRRLAGIDTEDVNGIYIRLNKAVDTKEIMGKISEEMSEVSVTSADSSLSVADSLFSLSERFIWLISIVIIIVAVFLISKTVSANISERIKEIGIMKTVGWTSKNIRSQLTLELIIQGSMGSLLGVIAGILISFALSMFQVNTSLPWQGSPIPGSMSADSISNELVRLQVSISPLFVATVVILTIFITLLCGVFSSKRATSIKPAEALRKI